MNDAVIYWDKEWDDRILSDGSIKGNTAKVKVIVNELWNRPYLIKARKLDIGCGPATHARKMCEACSEFGDKYLGLDTSQRAVDEVERAGLTVFRESIRQFEKSQKFDSFFFFDVLEHIKDHDSVAKKVKELGSKEFSVLINVPLYLSVPEGGFERPVDIQVMHKFLTSIGCQSIMNKVYGINGYPYMFLEGVKS